MSAFLQRADGFLQRLNVMIQIQRIGDGIIAEGVGLARLLLCSGKQDREFSGAVRCSDDALQSLLKYRVFEISRHAHGDRKVERPDENAVHTGKCGDFLDLRQRLCRLALRNQQNLSIKMRHGFSDGQLQPPAKAVLSARTEAAFADGGVFCPFYQIFYFLRSFYVRDNQTLCGDVQQL